jgi:CheY-like chemotaxis protein
MQSHFIPLLAVFLRYQLVTEVIPDTAGTYISAPTDDSYCAIPVNHLMSEIDRDQSARLSTSAKTILVVDDDREILGLVSNYLRSWGYFVLTAASGVEGISAAEAHSGPIDLLLADVDMPGMTGIEFAKYLLRRSSVPVIFMSGFGEAQNLDSLPGDVGFLPKPFSLADLAQMTRRFFKSEK